ncbi:MAG: FecR domain-containing protein, partial [Gallionella sp.]
MSHALAQPASRLTEEAASWFLKLNDPSCTETDRRAFDVWLAADEANRAEYGQFERLWQTLDRLPPKRKNHLRKATLTILLTAGALAILSTRMPPTEQQLIATSIGERRHLVLVDGSELDINADSRIRTDYSWFSRRIEVESGEAVFKVAPDKLRPFEVRAATGTMRDIGTTFDVANGNGSVTVGVIEGKVEVSLDGHAQGILLKGGEQLAYAATGETLARQLDADATAWRDGRWLFKDTPLDEVVADMNRQHLRQTILNEPALSRLHVSGAFNINDRAGLLKALETLYPLRAME